MQVKGFEWCVGLTVALAVLAFGGCTKEDAKVAGSKDDAQSAVVPKDAANKFVVSVNGKGMTQADVDQQVDLQMAAWKGRVPDERLEQGRDRMAFNAMDQFVVKTLLLDEAKKQGIEISQEDVDSAVERIKQNLPEGRSWESLVEENPNGEPGLIDDITVGLKINKLLEQELEAKLAVSDDEVASFMKENADSLQKPERVKARHILIKVDPSDDEATKAEKKKKIEAIRQQIVDGADFAELAKEDSDCPSGASGGDLGFFTRGRMAKPFEDAAFGQEVGQLGPVIETQFGYHIVEVTDKEPAGEADAEEVRSMLKRRKQDSVVRDYIQSLREGAEIFMKDEPVPEN